VSLSTRRLLHWGDLDESRRRRGRLRDLLLVIAGAGIAALVASQDLRAASKTALIAIVGAYTWIMLGTSFRMYWRPDSPILARLPVPGGPLFDVALIRSLRAAGRASLIALPAAGAIAAHDVELALRHAAIAGAVGLAAALLLPAVALGAGAIVAGGKAQSLMRAVGGAEVAAPPSAWLGVLPGLAAAAVVLGAIAAADWARGGVDAPVPPVPMLAGLAGGALVAALAARQAAPSVMPLAVREVAALDLQRLAHLEVHPPTALERLIAGRLPRAAALVHAKDARLLRRRFPMAYVTGAVTTLALWIVAGARPDNAWLWVAGILAGFAGYGVIMASRLVTRPIELPFLATLPVSHAHAVAAKRAALATWTLLYPTLGTIPVAIFAPRGLVCAGVAAAIVLASLVAGFRVAAGAPRAR